MIYLFFERDSKTAQARQVATYDSATAAWEGERVQMLQRTLSFATVEGQEPDILANPDQLLKIFTGSRIWAVPENGVAAKHLRGTPNDHDQSSHAGDRGGKGPSKAQYAAWEKMSPKERLAKWEGMDEVARDKFNSPSTSIQQALMGEAAQFGPWKQASWDKALKDRLKQYNDYIPEDTKGLILDRMLEAEVIFRNAGVSPEQTRSLMQGMTDALAVQEHESLGRQLGDHGVRHLLGDEVMAQEILMLHPAEDTPQQRAALMLAAVYHDTGYLTPSGRLIFGEDHPRTSTVHYNANLKGEVKTALGSEVANNVSNMIATHDSTEIDWSQPGVTALRLADNLALFHKEKLPGLFKYVPANIDTLTRLGSGKVTVDAAKVEMRNNIANANLPNRVRDALYRAADEVNPLTAKTTLGRLNGEITGFDWVGGGAGHLRVAMTEGTTIPAEVFAQLDMGRKQFDKFAKAYGLDPNDLWDDNQFQVSMGTVTLLEGNISPAVKALLDALVIPVKHLPGQHDQDSHGSWARSNNIIITVGGYDRVATEQVMERYGGRQKIIAVVEEFYAVPGLYVQVSIEALIEGEHMGDYDELKVRGTFFPSSTQTNPGQGIGGFNDSIYWDADGEAVLYAHDMTFIPEYRDKGLAKGIAFNKLRFAHAMGVDSMQFDADGTVGLYAWAKYGAGYANEDGPIVASDRFQDWSKHHGYSEPSTGWPKFKTPYDVATYRDPDGRTFTTPPGGSLQYNFAVDGNQVFEFGKAFMLDLYRGHKNWDAKLQVNWRDAKMIIPIKHLPGQHDQDTHGSWATGSKLSQVPKVILRFEENFANPSVFSAPEEAISHLRFENGCAVDANGDWKWEGTSHDPSRIDMSRTVWHSIKNGTFTHNHPPETTTVTYTDDGRRQVDFEFDIHGISQPPSSTDVMTTAYFNLQEMRVIGYRDDTAFVFRVIRPPSGEWPSKLMQPDYYGETMKKIRDDILAERPMLRDQIDEGSFALLDTFWKQASEELGFIYKVEEWKNE